MKYCAKRSVIGLLMENEDLLMEEIRDQEITIFFALSANNVESNS